MPIGFNVTRVYRCQPGSPADYVWQQGASVVAKFLASGNSTLITPEHTLHVLEIIEAASKSQATGQRVSLVSTFKYPVVN